MTLVLGVSILVDCSVSISVYVICCVDLCMFVYMNAVCKKTTNEVLFTSTVFFIL